MKVNPEAYRMAFTAISVPRAEQPYAERVEQVKQQLSGCLAQSVIRMDRFVEQGTNQHGDETHTLELFVFTREEMNAFMESVADATVQYIKDGGGLN